MHPVLRNLFLWIIGLAESLSSIGTWITMMTLFALVVFDGGARPGAGDVLRPCDLRRCGAGPDAPALASCRLWYCGRTGNGSSTVVRRT